MFKRFTRSSSTMSNIKDDLDQYLLLQSDQKKATNSFKIDMKIPPMNVPEIRSFFSRAEPTEANSWLKDSQESSCLPQLTRMQRLIGFVTCLGLGIFCMTVSTFYIPLLLLKARKFALLYTLGSVFFILSFCFLSGFAAFFKQMFSKTKLPISLTYTGCMIATLYFAMVSQSTALTVLFAVPQVIALLLMIVGSIPGGTSGIKFFGQMFKNSVSNSLPV